MTTTRELGSLFTALICLLIKATDRLTKQNIAKRILTNYSRDDYECCGICNTAGGRGRECTQGILIVEKRERANFRDNRTLV